MKAIASLDVLICGAGAAGLTLAIDLARRGVSFRLIDKLPGPFEGSRGKGIQPRTLEVFEDLGVIDRLAAVGSCYPPARNYDADGRYSDGQEIAVEPPTVEEPYRTPLLVPQAQTEAVLRERLAELGHRVEYGVELASFAQDEEGVLATLTCGGQGEAVRCRYLVGSDGGRPTVRHALDVGFPGMTLHVRAIVADVALDGLSRDAWHRFNEGDMSRRVSFCPLPHADLFQLQAPIPLEGEIDLSAAGLQAFVDARLPDAGLRIRAVRWASAYSMNARLADRYRVGRVFLMGDAAHIHPPTGGQGLNTSVQDAYNLGWKLAGVLAGAPDALLDTYEEERRPIAAGMLGLATDLLEKAKQGDMRRGREVHQLDLGYPGSSLSVEAPDRRGHVLAGDRVPDAALVGAGGQPKRLFEVLAGPHWTLLVREPSTPGGIGARPGRRVFKIGAGAALDDGDDRLGLRPGEVLAVRPDGYAGAILDARKLGDLERYFDAVLPRVA